MVADLADFEKQELQQLADNLRKPGGRIPDPNPNAAPGATIPTPAFTYGAKSEKRLTVACDLVRFYQTVGRDLTAANIQWNQVMSNFKIQWEAEIKCQEQLLHTRIWKGQSNFSLENFISRHRNAYVSMQASAEHVQYQLPNEHSRVGFLLEVIQCSGPGLQAAMASIKTDNGPEGMRNNFEATAAHLLPYDPVAKKRSSGQKRGSAQISSVMDPSPTTTKKPSIGKTGVHLCYYKTGEYRNLANEQKEELKGWRANNPNTFKAESKKAKKEVPKKSKSSMKKQVASLVEAALSKSVKFDDQVNDEEKYIMSMVQAAVTKTLNQKNDQQSKDKPQVTLKSILKPAKNNGSS